MTEEVPVITVDGPGGSGKGTISCLVANRLGWHYLDSGALYRILAHAAMEAGVQVDEAQQIAALVPDLSIEFVADDEASRIVLNGRDITDVVRTEECGKAASKIAVLMEVRSALVDLQQRFREAPGLVADGRDMGTIVFPDAGIKIFLTASARERAIRRHKQLNQKGFDVNLENLFCDLEERDRRDAERAVSPLKPASDAFVIDTTGMSIKTVMEKVLQIVESHESAQ